MEGRRLRTPRTPPRRVPIQDRIDYRRHRNACRYYREDWRSDDALYRCICLLDMPPETQDEQDLCLKSRRGCWRFRVANALGVAAPAARARASVPSDDEDPDDVD